MNAAAEERILEIKSDGGGTDGSLWQVQSQVRWFTLRSASRKESDFRFEDAGSKQEELDLELDEQDSAVKSVSWNMKCVRLLIFRRKS